MYQIPEIVNKIICGDALMELKKFPSESIDTIITSPPYYGLRDYSMDSQIGLEKTFDEYLAKLLQITAELKRVMKPTATLFWNHGDSYSVLQKLNYPAKCMLLQNYRLVIKMIEQGFILRNILIWYKPNCMPSSVKDRYTIDYEPIFFFVKTNDTQYWVNKKTGAITDKQPLGTKGIEAIDWDWKDIDDSWQRPSRDEVFKIPNREKSTYATAKRKKVSHWSGRDYWFEQQYEPMNFKEMEYRKKIRQKGKYNLNNTIKHQQFYDEQIKYINPQGRNMRAVWKISTQSFSGAHFATFSEKLVEPMIRSGCPEFICKKCEKAKEKIYTVGYQSYKTGAKAQVKTQADSAGNLTTGTTRPQQMKFGRANKITQLVGYTDCGCSHDDGWHSGIVLDPFCGAGTTCLVAKKLGRKYIGIDLSEKYCEMARKRLSKEGEYLF